MIKKINKKEIFLDSHSEPIILETGWKAKKANGSVWIKQGGTVVLVTAVMNKKNAAFADFFPLTVNYIEKFYAVGKIPGGFLKREGRPTDKETLVSRLIDRPLRPLFPDGFRNETQVIATVVSSDPTYPADILALNGASAAISISDIPFNGPVAAVRVGKKDGSLIVNPTQEEIDDLDLNIIVAGTYDAIVMVEAGMKNVKEEEVIEALDYGHSYIKKIAEAQVDFSKECGKEKFEYKDFSVDENLLSTVNNMVADKINEALRISDRNMRYEALDKIRERFLEGIGMDEKEENLEGLYKEAFDCIEKKVFREYLLNNKVRVDGRKFDDIRDIDIEVGLLEGTHGSSLFTRGETQSLATTTLGTKMDTQLIDNIEGSDSKRFMLHYNFPPYCVGEVGFLKSPGRREIGHGALAERALETVIPDEETFPYTIRVVSEILESNGSSSMATVCSGCLSLMDAGVPISDIVAGIAMGLIYEKDEHIILTDIMGLEDHLGDMDFKVAGTESGITALQMDIKVEGLNREILEEALEKARKARLYVLSKMKEVLPAPRKELSPKAPRFETIKINPDKVGLLIGPAGKNIKRIIEETKASIDILDGGIVNIFAKDADNIEKAKAMIQDSMQELVENNVYKAKVKKIVDYGMFVELLPLGIEGLLHISQIDRERIDKIEDHYKEGDIIEVEYLGKDARGRIKLSRKVLLK